MRVILPGGSSKYSSVVDPPYFQARRHMRSSCVNVHGAQHGQHISLAWRLDGGIPTILLTQCRGRNTWGVSYGGSYGPHGSEWCLLCTLAQTCAPCTMSLKFLAIGRTSVTRRILSWRSRESSLPPLSSIFFFFRASDPRINRVRTAVKIAIEQAAPPVLASTLFPSAIAGDHRRRKSHAGFSTASDPGLDSNRAAPNPSVSADLPSA